MNDIARRESPATSARPDDGARGSRHGLWVWSNIAGGVVLFIAIQWYLQNVYRYRPWIPTLTVDRAQTVVALVYGWLAHPLLSAFNKGKLGAFLNPARFFDEDTARLAASKGLTAALAIAIAVVVVAINLFPMLHLRYDADESTDAVPVVLVEGRPRQFHDNTIPIFDLGDEPPDIVVTGNHNLYRIPLSAADMARVGITTHKQVFLDRYFVYEDLHVVLSDTSDVGFARFTVRYDGEHGLEEGCPEVEEHSFHDAVGCAELLRAMLDTIGRNLMGRDTGVVSYRGRTYRYDYALDNGANVRIRVPPAISELARDPGRALDILGRASERTSLLASLHADLDNMSDEAKGRLFLAIFRSNSLYVHLRGTMAQQQLALEFVRDVLSRGVEYVDDPVTTRLMTEIERRSLGPSSSGTVFVPGIKALVALIGDDLARRYDVLAVLNAFLERLGTDHNQEKPKIARVFVQMLHDEIDTNMAGRVLDGLAIMYNTARGIDPVVADISQIIAERRDELFRDDLLLGLDGLEEREVVGYGEGVEEGDPPQ